MSQSVIELESLVEVEEIAESVVDPPDLESIVTEDDIPVDNIYSAKQQRLLVEPTYTSWDANIRRLADANVGLFRSPYAPPVVPDMFLSLDVEVAEDWYAKEHRSYFIWVFGKAPEVVIEIVSNKKGGELGRKMREYARMGIWYCVVYDPQLLIQDTALQMYELRAGSYRVKETPFMEEIGLGLTLWQGTYEGKEGQWLRWCDEVGYLLLTGAEAAAQERHIAQAERQRAERLAAKLRSLGVDPDALE